MPETKAINNAMAILLFILMKFGLQNNGILSKKLPSLQNFLKNTDLQEVQAPQPYCKSKGP